MCGREGRKKGGVVPISTIQKLLKQEEEELFQIRYVKLTFTLAFLQQTKLPQQKVSMIRGGIGEMLLQGNCIADRNCETCSFREECVVQQIYYHKLKIVPDYVQGKESLGYLYECRDTKTNYREGETLLFQMLLFGNVIIHFPVILQAIYRLGIFGIGKDRAAYRLVQIENQRGEKILQENNVYLERLKPDIFLQYIKKHYRETQTITKIRFITPLAQKHEGNFLTSFQADAIVDSIYRRIYLLNCMEGHAMERCCLFRGSLQIERQEVRKVKIPRYSGTQNKIIYLSGIEGTIWVKVKEEFIPYLLAGELAHIGKNTSMGFGQYVLGWENNSDLQEV